MSRLTRPDLEAAEVVWLLSVTWAGQVYRFSSYPVAPVDEDGRAIPFDGRLEDIEYEDALGMLTTSPELRTVAATVIFDQDVAQRVAAGHDLSAATGELALWVVGSAYEDRQVLLVGQVSEPEYGGVDEPVSFSLEENPWDDASLIPDSTARVTYSTWDQGSYTTPDEALGLYYPTVFGQPGLYTGDDGSSGLGRGSPTVVADHWNVTGEAALLVIAGHPVEAGTVLIIDGDGAYVSRTVVHMEDGLGRTVATVDMTTTSAVDKTTELWCCWAYGPALTGTGGAGDLFRYMMRLSSLRVAWGRLEVLVPKLNAYQVAGYIDSPCSPWEWVQDNLLSILPVSVTSGPDGLFPVLWQYDATAKDAVAVIRAGAGIERTTPVQYERTRSDVINEVRLSYAVDGSDGALLLATLTPNPDPNEASQLTTYHSQASASRYGTVAMALDTDLVWDRTTARLVAVWLVRAQGFTTRIVTYEVDVEELGWLAPGQVVLLTDDELSFDGQVCILRSRTYTDSGRVSLSLLLLEDPARDAPGKSLGAGR